MTSHLAREIRTQPKNWADAASLARDNQHLFPRPGERVAVIGCGTSVYMGQAYAARREALGLGATDAFAASEHRLGRGYDRAVIICRSGTTTEVLEALADLDALGIPNVALVATPGTPVTEAATRTICLSQADERSVVQTRFATTALALLRESLGDHVLAAAEAARTILKKDVHSALGRVADAEQITFLGTGWTNGVANEAALKLRESALMWTESYPAMEYRHGPISIAGPGRAVWILGEAPAGLREQIEATGAHVEHRDADAMVELVRVHLLCEHAAKRSGLDPDQPRHLTRSIVLT